MPKNNLDWSDLLEKKSLSADEELCKSVYNAGMHPPKGYVPGKKKASGPHAEYDPKYSFKENKELVRMHHNDHKMPINNETHLDSLTRAAAKRGGHETKE